MALCARFYGKEVLGYYSFAIAILAPIYLLGGFNLKQLASSYPGDKKDLDSIQALQLNCLIVTFIVAMGLSVIVFIRSEESAYAIVLLAVAIVMFLETIINERYGILARDNRFTLLGSLRTIRAVTTVLWFVVGYLIWDSLIGSLVSMAIGSMVVYILVEKKFLPIVFRFTLDRFSLNTILLALLSGGAAVVDSLVVMLPRQFLGWSNDFESVASFTAVVQIAIIPSIIVNALGNVAIPRFRVEHRVKKWISDLFKIHLAIAAIIALMAFVFWIYGDEIVRFLFGSSFSDMGTTLLKIVPGCFFWLLAGINGCLLQAKGAYRWHFASTALALVAGASICLTGISADDKLSVAVNAYVLGMLVRLLVSFVGIYFVAKTNDHQISSA